MTILQKYLLILSSQKAIKYFFTFFDKQILKNNQIFNLYSQSICNSKNNKLYFIN